MTTQPIEIPSWVLHLATIRHIQPKSFIVYAVLLKFAQYSEGERDYQCSLGIEQLSKEARLPVGECFTAIVDLQVNEVITLGLFMDTCAFFCMPIDERLVMAE